MKDDAATARAFMDGARADRELIETRLASLVDGLANHHPVILEAIRYTLLGGGKRLRPLLCVWTHDYLGDASTRTIALDSACALECVHTYSLIHDDLPCMDDDDLRRGRPSCHVRFGEANAVLTGDALLTLAFEILTTIPARHGGGEAVALQSAASLAGAAGTGGLITGQALDLESEGSSDAHASLVERIHTNKTARLIAVSMELGAVAAGAPAPKRGEIRDAGLLAGRAFQIVDDILDIETDEETLGKTPGKDVKEGKLTYPSVVGLERARSLARALIDDAKATLAPEGEAVRLREAMDFIVDRVA
jgi:geranylgeranyl pyrophosphate synthase